MIAKFLLVKYARICYVVALLKNGYTSRITRILTNTLKENINL